MRQEQEKYQVLDVILPASRDINSFAMLSFEKDGQNVRLPVRFFSFSDRPVSLMVSWKRSSNDDWNLLGTVTSLPAKISCQEQMQMSGSDFLILNRGNASVQFKSAIQILIPRGNSVWQAISLGDNTILPPGYAGTIRVGAESNSSQVHVQFEQGDLFVESRR